MNSRESKIRQWFAMWLEQKDLGIEEIFSEDAVYVESWGPEYHGSEKIKFWFEEWNSRGRVLVWEIRQFFHKEDRTMVEWYFKDQMKDGKSEAFDGVSLIGWDKDGRISYLKEFGCNIHNYDPYEKGPVPQFRGESSPWF